MSAQTSRYPTIAILLHIKIGARHWHFNPSFDDLVGASENRQRPDRRRETGGPGPDDHDILHPLPRDRRHPLASAAYPGGTIEDRAENGRERRGLDGRSREIITA